MRLEYTEEQERQLRITELEAVLDNGLYENEEDVVVKLFCNTCG